jgi:hypothetical protein
MGGWFDGHVRISRSAFLNVCGTQEGSVDVSRDHKVTTTDAVEAVFFKKLDGDLVLDPVRVEVRYLSRR